MHKAWRIIESVAERREDDAWEVAQTLAHAVLDDHAVTLANAILKAGSFAMQRAMELAELLTPKTAIRLLASTPAVRR